MKNIQIGSVKMPLTDFVVSRNAILGITKSGKTYTAKGVAEQLLEHDIPIIVFDAIGVWRYLKTPGDGANAKGFKVVVAGGEHPDLPLTPKSAPEIVRAAIKENIPLIIDLYDSKLSKADWRRIVQDCFRILLYENKGLRHVFLEEAAEFAPQKVIDGVTYAEVEKLARMGGNKGVGITFINQRAQELNKAVLELCDNVVLLRQRGSHAIDSLEKWLDRLAPDTAKEIANSMPHMTQGDCWIFTENAEVPIRTRSGLIRSLHPDRRMPEQALSGRVVVDADVFVKRLTTELPKLAEEQKENDPVALKKRIAELERQIKSTAVIVSAKPQKPVEIPILVETELYHIKTALRHYESAAKAIEEAKPIVEKISSELEKFTVLTGPNKNHWTFTQPAGKSSVSFVHRSPSPRTLPVVATNGDLNSGERKVMIAVAQYPEGVTRETLKVLTGYRATSLYEYSRSVVAKGCAELRGDLLIPTQHGVATLGTDYEPLPTGDALVEHWRSRLTGGERKIFEIVITDAPQPVSRERIMEVTGFKGTSTYEYTRMLKARRVVVDSGNGIEAAPEFFK